ncbi:MAG: YkgJ family cysteine cluster protein [Planctomycetota bacterium]
MALRPILRETLARQTLPGGEVRLGDPATGCWVSLSPAEAALLPALSGELDLAELVRVHGPEAEPVIRSLALVGFLLGVGDAARRRRVEARAAWPVASALAPFALLQETRFRCNECGACCRSRSFGPLSSEEVARLEALAGEERAAVSWVEEEQADETAARRAYLARGADGACVFLTPERRCGVQLELGPEAKPLACRVFPLALRATPGGLVVADSRECATFPESSAAGPALHEDFDAWRPLLRAQAAREPFRDGALQLPSGLWVLAAQLRELWPHLIDAAGSAETWVDGLRAARAGLLRYEALVAGAPLEPELLERTSAAFASQPLPAQGPPGAEPAAFAAALARCTARLEARLEGSLRAALEPALRAARGEEVELGAWSAELEPAALRALCHSLQGARLEDGLALATVFAEALLAALLAELGARARAAAAGRSRAAAEDLAAALPEVARGLGAPGARAALAELAAPATTLLLALPASGRLTVA